MCLSHLADMLAYSPVRCNGAEGLFYRHQIGTLKFEFLTSKSHSMLCLLHWQQRKILRLTLGINVYVSASLRCSNRLIGILTT